MRITRRQWQAKRRCWMVGFIARLAILRKVHRTDSTVRRFECLNIEVTVHLSPAATSNSPTRGRVKIPHLSDETGDLIG